MDKTPEVVIEEKPEKTLLQAYQKTIALREDKLFYNGKEIASDADGSEIKDIDAYARSMMRGHYRSLISKPFENVIILTGAGTSKSSGGKIMKELWDEAFPVAKKADNEAFFKIINFPNPTKDSEKNLEELLSQSQKALGVLSPDENAVVADKIKEVEALVVEACTLTLKADSPHSQFLNKVTSRKLKYSRVKIFTLNYDTLFEQAAAEGNFVLINGFSFSNPHYFNGAFFDYDLVNRKNSRVTQEENFVSKVFHLYKPHGSINWEKIPDGRIVSRDIDQSSSQPLIIYPNSNKYESGYDQPFFEMMSRFQQSVRQPNTLLLCVGFSFGDKHFKSVVKEAVKSNPGLNLLIALSDFTKKEQVKDILELTEKQNNITFVDDNFQNISDNYPFSIEYENDGE